MPLANQKTNEAEGIRMVRMFDAPPELVFRDWIDPRAVRTWFAPEGYEVTRCRIDARPGGAWRVEFESKNGERYAEFGVFECIEPPIRLIFTLTQSAGVGRTGPMTRVSVTFVERDEGTEMHFEQSGYTSKAMRDGNAQGWSECFGKLNRRFAAR